MPRLAAATSASILEASALAARVRPSTPPIARVSRPIAATLVGSLS